MDAMLAKKMMDACYIAKRARDLLPELPKGVTASYVQCLDEIRDAEQRGQKLKVSDISDKLGIKRPGITRTVNEMESKGYIIKMRSDEDGRIVFITSTKKGEELLKRFDTDYFDKLVPMLSGISDEDANVMIDTIKKLYDIMEKTWIQV